METFLSTTTEGQMRVDQANELLRWNSARDIVVRAKGGNLLHRPEETVREVAATAADRSCPPRVFHRQQLHLRQRSGA